MSADDGGETLSIPAANGELQPPTPDPPVLSTPGKRKRGSSHDVQAAQDASTSESQSQERIKLHETLRNIVEILSKNDTELQLLSCPLSSSPAKPRSKRAKVSGEKDESASIQARVATDRYNTVSEFLSDIDRASAAVIEKSKSQNSGVEAADGTRLTETVNRIAAFKKLLNSLVRQASVGQPSVKRESTEDDAEAPERLTPSTTEPRSDNVVLTILGNPSNPKQLFSSLQKSVKVSLPSGEAAAEKYVEVQAPLREIGLPSGVTTTKVAPYNLENKPKEAKRTFGEVFAPRPTLPQLEPPRRARSSSRAAPGGWIDPFEAITNYKTFPGERNNYCLAPLPSGQWLQYGGVTSSPSYWDRRQKQHSVQQHGDERYHEDPALWTDDDASVLQGVYSSFAPSFDSSGAIVQADSKDMLWWGKKGTKRLYTLLTMAYSAEAEETPKAVADQPANIGELDESTLEEMVNAFNPDDFADHVSHTGAPQKEMEDIESKDMEGLLGDVSELLETLSSYQKIRNLELPLPAGQGAEPKDKASDQGTPSQASAAEQTIYETLKASLSALVSNLPPYAVAKLDGDQLAELSISAKVLVDNPDYHGTMEKDDFTLQQERAAAIAPMSAAPNRTSTPNARSANYQAGYNQRAYAANTRVQAPPVNFQAPQPYYGARQPSTPGPYTPGHPQHYAGARPPATPSQRPGFVPGYAQPTPQYNQVNMQQFQRPGQNGYNPYVAPQAPTPAQASPQPYTPRPPQPGTYNAQYAAGRSGSPQKQPTYATPRSRTPYMAPGPAPATPQQRYVPQQQQPAPPHYNFPSNQAPPAPNTYSNSAAAMTYARSAAEQAALMDRNKAQLAAQQTRQSATPQPATDASSQDRSVTPAIKQNGTPVPS
ncbi:uncharacterized protein ACLA_039360 [Aspergillus clavatus NRRL 1]|uniref:Uncharacterized protein n=1 Tax=Aspergillus clavatus (strain ATCC 1007 / CBS 513.65 / DSM 816 / NCTC 3887 / NRRL 1 / QM 1276 / 107) TaxID=344612 RepID=A1CKP7_ASPCL|nr:uncharacterized protein ACLA_039360 [Aspergillus clavatus NRRL 1]EAW09721.1 conserved hypothetical protein [Aspergillus clavatus NRRL 1]